jgi:2-oxoglutarate dehydrogenase E2 component (dihydrolipoamide succinyltransferase)
MAETELIMPKMGESIMEATILKWVKNVGETIKVDESVLEIATDKVDSEVPSPVAGILTKLLYNVGDVVPVGKAIALISTDRKVAQPATEVKTNPVEEVKVPYVPSASSANVTSTSGVTNSSNRFYSPLVLNIAKEEGIAMSDLEKIPGTGNEGRVTKKDIIDFVKNKKTAPSQSRAESSKPSSVQPNEPVRQQVENLGTTQPGGNTELIEMDRMRRLIADHMVMSKHTSPHVTSFVEADVTEMVRWREKVKKQFEKREGEKITFTPLFIEAVVKAIKDFPLVNSSVDGYTIIRKKNINIGMAAALPSGNLIVPVIKNADQKNLVGLTKEVNDLANRARKGQLKPTEIEGGTFTITNVGTFGNLMGTPIINQPQVAILATGAIRKKPAVLETEMGDVIAIRHMMFLSLSYDHRIVDGALGGAFLRRIADNLEQFDGTRDF